MARVIQAWKTDFFPCHGNISEEVLALDTGQWVYLNPVSGDAVYETLEEALEACTGNLEPSDSLCAAWHGRDYPVQDTHP